MSHNVGGGIKGFLVLPLQFFNKWKNQRWISYGIIVSGNSYIFTVIFAYTVLGFFIHSMDGV